MSTKKHKILMIGPVPPQIGGLETFMADLLASDLSSYVDLVHLNNTKPAVHRRAKYKAPDGYAASFRRNVFLSAISYSYSVWFFFKFLFLLTFWHFDIIHIHTVDYTSFWEKCPFILAARFRRIAVVLHIHAASFDAFYRDSSPRIKKWIRYFLKICNRLIVLSASWGKFFSGIVGPEKICVVPNGIDLRPFKIDSVPRQKAVLFLGEISRRKGIDDFLHAVALVQSLGHSFIYHIVGPGEIDRAQQIARGLGLGDGLTFWGPLTGVDKNRLLLSSSCFVLPSHAEGLPISILEAFACGLAVISTRVGGIPELIVEEENGFLLQPGDVASLAKCIVRIMTENKLARRMAEKNLKLAGELYDINKCARSIDQIYCRMLGMDPK
ncbi:glycosyltransferase family 4 protein [candidate division KSB1 bacterium]|nr:glycosyltransferase family 4 protein [candidate division KSB1 bacterium]